MDEPFGLRFEDLVPGESVMHLAAPPPLATHLIGDGWARLVIGEGEAAAEVRLSYLYPPFVSLWGWAQAIAHRLLPITLRIDEEGCDTLLGAVADGEDGLRLTVRQNDTWGKPYRCLSWREPRVGWLDRLGETFGAFLGESFDVRAWRIGPGLWPEPAQYLPWNQPGRQAQTLATAVSDRPAQALYARFFLSLVHALNPSALRKAWHPDDHETFARLRFLLTRERIKALEGASRALNLALPKDEMAALKSTLDAASDLFELFEIYRETGVWVEREELSGPGVRVRALLEAAHGFEAAFHVLAMNAEAKVLERHPEFVTGAAP